MSRSKGLYALIGFGAAVAGAAWYGSRYNPGDLRTLLWYKRLEKPSFNPPNSVFPYVWTGLYALMAVSGWRVWNAPDSPERSRALRLWVTQLATNAQWTRLFFGRHLPKWALADVLALEAQVLAYIAAARQVDTAAAACFLPYAAWVAFATLLNAEIVRRNPDAERMFPHAAA